MSCDADPIHMLRGKIQPTAPGHLCLADYVHIQSTLDIVRPGYATRRARKGAGSTSWCMEHRAQARLSWLAP